MLVIVSDVLHDAAPRTEGTVLRGFAPEFHEKQLFHAMPFLYGLWRAIEPTTELAPVANAPVRAREGSSLAYVLEDGVE